MLYQLSYFRKNIPYQSQPTPRGAVLATCFGICNSDRLFSFFEWEVMDSNHRRRTPADLQSAPFGHSGNFPLSCAPFRNRLAATSSGPPRVGLRADGGIRTHDQLITNQLLWPTELHRQRPFWVAKVRIIFHSAKYWNDKISLLHATCRIQRTVFPFNIREIGHKGRIVLQIKKQIGHFFDHFSSK